MTRMVSFRCPKEIKDKLEDMSNRLSIDQTTIINQGILIRMDEINSGILEGPSVRFRRTRKIKIA